MFRYVYFVGATKNRWRTLEVIDTSSSTMTGVKLMTPVLNCVEEAPVLVECPVPIPVSTVLLICLATLESELFARRDIDMVAEQSSRPESPASPVTLLSVRLTGCLPSRLCLRTVNLDPRGLLTRLVIGVIDRVTEVFA